MGRWQAGEGARPAAMPGRIALPLKSDPAAPVMAKPALNDIAVGGL